MLESLRGELMPVPTDNGDVVAQLCLYVEVLILTKSSLTVRLQAWSENFIDPGSIGAK